MKHSNLLTMVFQRAKSDEWCRQCREVVDKHENNYLAFLNTLPEEQQEMLELYIGACEAWCDSHIFVAYQLGREHREIAAYHP